MKLETKTMEESARAVHETYYGKGTWKDAGSEQRGYARQAVRVMLSALERNGVALGGEAAPVPAAPAAALKSRPAPVRPAPPMRR